MLIYIYDGKLYNTTAKIQYKSYFNDKYGKLIIPAGPGLACFSQERKIFPSGKNCARLLGLALVGFFQKPTNHARSGLSLRPAQNRPSHPLVKLLIENWE